MLLLSLTATTGQVPITSVSARNLISLDASSPIGSGGTSSNNLDHKSKRRDKFAASAPVDASAKTTTGIPCLSWVNPLAPPRVALLCIHGLGLYSGSYNDFGTGLARAGIGTYAIDVRGFGSWWKAKGEQDLDFDDCMNDIKLAMTALRAAHPGLPIFLMGESMGGAIALRFAALHPEMIDGLICSVPAGERFKQKKTDVKVAMQLLKHPNKQFDIGNRIVNQATKNPEVRRDWESDPLDRMDISAKQLIRFQHFMDGNKESAQKLTTLPALFVQGTEDKLVKPSGTWELFNQLATEKKVFLAVPSEHLIFEETQHDDDVTKERNVHMVTSWIFVNTNNTGSLIAPREMPDLSPALTKLAAGQYADARRLLEQLASTFPMNKEVNYWLGVVYAKSNMPLLARKQMGKSNMLARGPQRFRQTNAGNARPDVAQFRVRPGYRPGQVIASSGDDLPSFDRASGQSLAQGKPTVLAFYADWCEQCNNLDKLIQDAGSVFGDQIKFVKIDVSDPKNENLVRTYKVAPIPSFVYLKKDGTMASMSIGDSGFVNFATGASALVR
jgi:alpha-beta hydrolase superfamily lysophospholipase/thiol-disulfide isomerase/thioredoxin